jgi:hypothetical protein
MTCVTSSCVDHLQPFFDIHSGSYANVISLDPSLNVGGASINTYASDLATGCEKKNISDVGSWSGFYGPHKIYSMVGVAPFTMNSSLSTYNPALNAFTNYEHRICTTEGFMLTYTFYDDGDGLGHLVYSFESLYSLDRHVYAFQNYAVGGLRTWNKYIQAQFTQPILGVMETSSTELEIEYFNKYNELNYGSRIGFDAIGFVDICEVV